MLKTKIKTPIPPHYNSKNAYDPAYRASDIAGMQSAAEEWHRQYGMHNVGADKVRIHMLIIDNQGDFDFPPPNGALYVGGRSGSGAMDDQDRGSQFIYQYLSIISEMTCTMDTHTPYQVFHPVAHIMADGSHPDSNKSPIIKSEQFKSGEVRANPAMAAILGVPVDWLTKQWEYYCSELERLGRYALMIWPYHCLLGSPGHRLVGVIEEARLFHCFARGAMNTPEIKGGNPFTEHYSIFGPEVRTRWDNGDPLPGAQKNEKLFGTLVNSDVVIIGPSQAKSHCGAWTIDDFLRDILAKDPKLAEKVYLLEDCTSPVVIPGVVDFTDQADAKFAEFANAGMKLVKSTDPIESWPGMEEILARLDG